MIYIRLDANAKVATGHLYRCLSIASQCRKKGKKCCFLLSTNDYQTVVEAAGFFCEVLELKWDDWDAGSEILKNYLLEHDAECLLVDSYYVTKHFFESIHPIVPLIYLDDLCRETYDVDAVIHYSEWDSDHFLDSLYQGINVKTFAGMKYMPLRDLFQSIEETPKQYDLLITTGGTDPFHVSLKLLEEILSKKTFDEFSICVILGRFNEDEELIRELIVKHNAKSPKTKITVLKNINNMKEIMCASKFAVSSGGTTVYELMACGVPFVCFGFSDDQVLFGERLGQHGNAFWGGDIRNNSCFTLDLLNSVEKLISLPAHEIKQLKEKNQNIVDGKGAARIADILISLEKK